MAEYQTGQKLQKKISSHSASVGVVGMGYVGLPFAVEKAKVGFPVLGIDQNKSRVEKLNRAENYILDVHDEELRDVVKQGNFSATDSFDGIGGMDIIVVCVPTPLDRNLAPDLQYVIAVTRRIAEHLRPGQLISLESTTYPGTTEEIMLPILAATGLTVEQDFFLCHSPERVDPGNRRYTTKNTNKVIGGVGPKSLELGLQFYAQTIEHMIPVSSARAAEMVKVFENTYRAVNIALVNELALLCDRMNLNVWEVLDAAFTKPFGIQPFYPGPGVGGHCIPLDPHYLEWKAREYNFTTRFIGLAGEINRKMPEYVRDKAIRVLNQDGKSTSHSQILLLGVTYKKDLNDCRESPALEVGELLLATGAKVFIHDPLVASVLLNGKQFDSVPLTEDTLTEMDLVVITTDHSTIDYEWLIRHARRVLDTRNATKQAADPEKKVVLL